MGTLALPLSLAAPPAMSADILFLCTGGTIDKHYPRTVGGYSFEFGQPVVESVLQRVRPAPAFSFRVVSVCKEDSQDITGQHRSALHSTIMSSTSMQIIITHGTDTMIETAQYLAGRKSPRVTIFISLHCFR